jgi:hypothetical protein
MKSIGQRKRGIIMKKVITALLVLTLVLTAGLSVSAAAVANDFVSNMDADTYLGLRLTQIDEALASKLITKEQAALLIEHVTEVAEAGTFGNGPTYGVKGDGNATCVLGEDSNLGIFRSESRGMRTGAGNGVGRQLADGSGAGNRGGGRGNGNR